MAACCGERSHLCGKASSVMIRNATHGLPYEIPADFNAAVVDLLKEH